RALCRILDFASARRVTTKRDSVRRCTKTEPVAETRQVSGGVGGKEINFFTVRIEQEARGASRTGIEIRFREDAIPARWNWRADRDANLLRHRAIIREIPIANVHRERIGIVEFD